MIFMNLLEEQSTIPFEDNLNLNVFDVINSQNLFHRGLVLIPEYKFQPMYFVNLGKMAG